MKKRGIVLILSGLFIIAAAVQAPVKTVSVKKAPFRAQDIFNAVKTTNIAMVKNIIAKYPNSIMLLDKNKNTPLYYAVEKGSAPIVKIILDQLTKKEQQLVNQVNSSRIFTPGQKRTRVRRMRLSSSRFLPNSKNISPFLLALKNMRNGAYKEFCNNLGVTCTNNMSPLSVAAAIGDKLAAQHFINLINKVDRDGRTPLFYAVLNGDFNMVKFLVEKGARVKIKDKPGVSLNDLKKDLYINNRLVKDPEFNQLVYKGKTPELLARLKLLPIIETEKSFKDMEFKDGNLTKIFKSKYKSLARDIAGRLWLEFTMLDPGQIPLDDLRRAGKFAIPFVGPVLHLQEMAQFGHAKNRILKSFNGNEFWEIVKYLSKKK